MNLRWIALSALITITLISGLSMAEEEPIPMNDSINDSVAATAEAVEMAPVAEIPAPEDAAALVQSLEGSWILNMADGQTSMMVHQAEGLLYGAANSEAPKPWNGVVTGEASEGGFEVQILSLQEGVLVSTVIVGSATADDLSGSFVQSDSQGKVSQGIVTGFLLSPDTSGYEPANVPAAVAPAAAAVAPAPEIPAAAPPAQDTNASGGIKPVDVTTFRDRFAVGAGAPLPV